MPDLTVSYNGYTFPFTPYVTRDEEFVYEGSKCHRISALSLEGVITGDAFHAIDGERNNILDAFSEDFKPLTAGNYTFDNIIVKGIDFSPNNVGKVEYSISLESYDEFFKNSNIINPVNNFTYKENTDGTVELSHNISAKGINTGDTNGLSAVAIAKTFCESLKGIGSRPLPAADAISDLNFGSAPFSVSESSDRANGSYSIEETYRQGINSYSGYVENFSFDVSSGIGDSFVTAKADYSIKGPPNTELSTLRSLVPTAATIYNKISGSYSFPTMLNSDPLNYSIKEVSAQGAIEISTSFDNNQLSNNTITFTDDRVGSSTYGATFAQAKSRYYDSSTAGYAFLTYNINVDTDEITELTTTSVDATMQSKGNLSARNTRVVNWLASLGAINEYDTPYRFLWALANDFYSYSSEGSYTFPGAQYWQLNPDPLNFSVEKDESAGTISLSASFDNRDYIFDNAGSIKNGSFAGASNNVYFKDFKFNVNKQCCMPVYSLEESVNPLPTYIAGNYSVFSHERLSMEETTMSVNATVADEGGPVTSDLNYGAYNSRLSTSYLNTCDAVVSKIIQSQLEPNFVGNESRVVTSQDSDRELLPFADSFASYGTNLGILSKNLTYTTIPKNQFFKNIYLVRNY